MVQKDSGPGCDGATKSYDFQISNVQTHLQYSDIEAAFRESLHRHDAEPSTTNRLIRDILSKVYREAFDREVLE